MSKKVKLGIICPSEIALRRFLPSLQNVKELEYIGVAVADQNEWNGILTEEIKQSEINKAQIFVDNFGGKIFHSYKELIECKEIDAVYLPLPPALHYKWAKLALENNKHVFVEKPSTTNIEDTQILIKIAKENNLVFHENYMFQYHSQINQINEVIHSGEIGKVQSFHSRFGFPLRKQGDFRYNKELGGGALLDAGGYIVKLATLMLGETVTLVSSTLVDETGYEVDMFGNCVFTNDKSQIFIGEFGMNCEYQCNLSVWGSKGILSTERIFTAPDHLTPILNIIKNNQLEKLELNKDAQFTKSILMFIQSISCKKEREKIYKQVDLQARLMNQIKEKCLND